MNKVSEKFFVGIDTSNYTTSVSVVNAKGEVIANIKRLLPVKEGENGLRQSDAVFAHVKNLSLLSDAVRELGTRGEIASIGYSAYPRDIEGSYMPCFLVGESVAKTLGAFLNVPIYKFSHQSGHIRAALYSSKAKPNGDFVAFHLSGGTTEVLHVSKGNPYKIDILGGSEDLHAGQAIDRAGVKMGLKFPCGKEMDALTKQNSQKTPKPKICVNGFKCNLSGLENMAASLYEKTKDPSYVSAFVFDFIGETVKRLSENVRKEYPDIKMIYAGGVSGNSAIQKKLENSFSGVYFASAEFSSDNAAGIALLAKESFENNL